MKNTSERLVVLIVVAFAAVCAGLAGGGTENGVQQISFTQSVVPVLKKYCLPCHAEESYNPSQLSLDNYELMMEGGKHGPAVVGGKPQESLLIQKLYDKPPFGDMMPLPRRRKSAEPPRRLTDEELRILTEWVRQGARGN
jgi:hypothetical protein